MIALVPGGWLSRRYSPFEVGWGRYTQNRIMATVFGVGTCIRDFISVEKRCTTIMGAVTLFRGKWHFLVGNPSPRGKNMICFGKPWGGGQFFDPLCGDAHDSNPTTFPRETGYTPPWRCPPQHSNNLPKRNWFPPPWWCACNSIPATFRRESGIPSLVLPTIALQTTSVIFTEIYRFWKVKFDLFQNVLINWLQLLILYVGRRDAARLKKQTIACIQLDA